MSANAVGKEASGKDGEKMMIKIRHHRLWRPTVKAASVLTAALLLAAGGGPGAPVASAVGEAISGSGSEWSFPIVRQWGADVAVQGTNVNVAGGGSSLGRAQFAGGNTDFGNSDIAYQGYDARTHSIDRSSRPYAYIPIISGGTALMYSLYDGRNRVDNVRLSGETIAKIFTGVITMWNDQQITGDMNGHELPAKKIQVLVNSAGTGTSYHFSDWLSKRYPDLWQRFSGVTKPTSYYPSDRAPNFSGSNGDDRIAKKIEGGSDADGFISFVQYSYPYSQHWPVAKVANVAGYFTEPTPQHVAFSLQRAHINYDKSDIQQYLTQELSDVYTGDDPRVYPLSSYSYMIIPIDQKDNHETPGKAQTFANFTYYALCDGQAQARRLGYSPLPYGLVAAAFEQVPKFSFMEPRFRSNQDPKTCDNPTFDRNDLSVNVLARDDKKPDECDRAGQGPCGASPNLGGGTGAGPGGGTSTGAGSSNGAGGGTNGPAANDAGGGTNGAGATGASGDGAAASAADPGAATDSTGSGTGTGTAATGKSSELAAFRSQGMTAVLGVLAAIELVLVLLLPAIVGRVVTRRRTEREGNS